MLTKCQTLCEYKQIKGIEDSFVVSDGIDIGYGKKIPLWLFGMLY